MHIFNLVSRTIIKFIQKKKNNYKIIEYNKIIKPVTKPRLTETPSLRASDKHKYETSEL